MLQAAGRPTGLRSEEHSTLQWLEQREAAQKWGDRTGSVGAAFRAEAEVLGGSFADDPSPHRRLRAHRLPAAGVPSGGTRVEDPPAPRPASALRPTSAPSPPPAAMSRAATPTEYARAYRWEAPLLRSVGAQATPPMPASPPSPAPAPAPAPVPTPQSEYSRRYAWPPASSPGLQPARHPPTLTDTLLAHHAGEAARPQTTYDRTFAWPYAPDQSRAAQRHSVATETGPELEPERELEPGPGPAPAESTYRSAFRARLGRPPQPDLLAAGRPTSRPDDANGTRAVHADMTLAARPAQRTTNYDLAFKDPRGYSFVPDGIDAHWVYNPGAIPPATSAGSPAPPPRTEYDDTIGAAPRAEPVVPPLSSWLTALAETRAAANSYRTRNERTEDLWAWRAQARARAESQAEALLDRTARRRRPRPAPYAEDAADAADAADNNQPPAAREDLASATLERARRRLSALSAADRDVEDE